MQKGCGTRWSLSYDSYNKTADTLRQLVGEMSNTAGSVNAASQQMSSTSEEAGKATGRQCRGPERARRQIQSLKLTRTALLLSSGAGRFMYGRDRAYL